jgi:hypothetical protein
MVLLNRDVDSVRGERIIQHLRAARTYMRGKSQKRKGKTIRRTTC